MFVFWIWTIFDCLSSRLSVSEKLFWIIVIFLFNLLGAFLYFVFSKKMRFEKMKVKGKKLLRSKKNRVIAGVCGGIGEYLGIDPTVIRLFWVLFTFLSVGVGLIAYIIAWILIPEKK